MTIPDIFVPVTGWRLWNLGYSNEDRVWMLGSVGSWMFGGWWRACEPVVAVHYGTVNRHNAAAPVSSCTCGLYAWRDPASAYPFWEPEDILCPPPSVLGEVAGWGRAIVHQHGWRAQYAYPRRVALYCRFCFDYWADLIILKPAMYVSCGEAKWPQPLTMCEEHYEQLRSRGPGGRYIPAGDVEHELCARYRRNYRSRLPSCSVPKRLPASSIQRETCSIARCL